MRIGLHVFYRLNEHGCYIIDLVVGVFESNYRWLCVVLDRYAYVMGDTASAEPTVQGVIFYDANANRRY